MPGQLDLDEVAEAYFSVPTPDRPEYERLLIRARGKAVFPLLRAVLAVTTRQREHTNDLARTGRRSIFGEKGVRYLWAKVTMEPIIQDAYDVVRRIGQPAKTELCRALLQPDYKMRLAAALLLSMDESPDKEVRSKVQEALNYIGPDQKQGTILILLTLVLARAGNAEAKMVIETHAQSHSLSFGEWIERSTNTALIELQRHK